MPKLLTTLRGRIIAAIVVVVLAAIGVLIAFTIPWFLKPYLVTLGVSLVLWVALEAWLKARARRKQASFDAAVAAKEGIEDRRREWANWTAELKKQGIDRNALPFYLLLGEPQSGKSVLLQNSDLHFPFGQNRLSGVGGTRGCDWWFTEEAVILDLAGRLFTHEGGASDEAEWQAFLDLLSNFRPMCPANGVLLVLPCDGLLKDTPQQASQKASRMQNALLTLVQRLQVQLPVYVVLTKGDKVFGFAESVHRLETEKRHEMFGWSRPAEKAETPFSIDEAREGFDYLLARCRALRAGMLASARIPEALGEVDRLYAFPDELAQVVPNLEVYLRKIFTESQLVERLFFRGIYLTSGLQTGAPVVKACAALLGGTAGIAGEADARNLESLFAKQRAYFIKDLVRKRLFEERGVVRPTKSRAAAARRSAWIGYGVGGAISVGTLALVVNYVPTFDKGLASAKKARDRTLELLRSDTQGAPLSTELGNLNEILGYANAERPAMENLLPFELGSSKPEYKDSFVLRFDKTMPTALRDAACKGLLEELGRDAPGAVERKRCVDGMKLLLLPIPWNEEARLGQYEMLVPTAERGELNVREMTRKRLEIDKTLPDPGNPIAYAEGTLSTKLNELATRERVWGNVLARLVDLHADLAASKDPGADLKLRPVTDKLLLGFLKSVDPGFSAALKIDPHLDDAPVRAFEQIADGKSGFDGDVVKEANRLRGDYLKAARDATIKWWDGDAADDDETAAQGLVRFAASLRLAAAYPEEMTSAAAHRSWLVRIDELVSRRMQKLAAKLHANWEVDPAEFDHSPLTEVARRATELVSETEFRNCDQRVRGSKLQRIKDELAATDALRPEAKSSRDELVKLLDSLIPTSPAELAGSEPAKWMRDEFAPAIKQLRIDEADSTHSFAATWATVPAEFLDRPLDPGKKVAEAHVASLLEALDRRLKRELRGAFVREFGETFFGMGGKAVWLCLVKGAPTHGTFREPRETLELSWLDLKKGSVSRIRGDFQLARTAKRTIRPAPSELDDESRPAWDAFRFLEALQTFLLVPERPTLAEAAVVYEFRPLYEAASLWNPEKATDPHVDWFGVTHGGREVVDEITSIGNQRSKGTFKSVRGTWKFLNDAALVLGWNKDAAMPEQTDVGNERFVAQFPGPFGLLNFVWDGKPEEGDANKIWLTTLTKERLSGVAPLAAPFRIELERALPQIPESIRNRDWSK